jgi:hypothetical protein
VNRISPQPTPSHSPSTSTATPSEEGSYQYQRALALSRSLRDSLYALSGAQLRQIRQQNAAVARASDTAQQLSTGAHALSDRMIGELKVVRDAAATLPTQVQSGMHALTAETGAVIGELTAIVSDKELAAADKGKA